MSRACFPARCSYRGGITLSCREAALQPGHYQERREAPRLGQLLHITFARSVALRARLLGGLNSALVRLLTL